MCIYSFIKKNTVYNKHARDLLTKDDATFYIQYNDYFTVQHVLLEWHDLAHLCSRLYHVNSPKELFASSPSSTVIINYLKETGLQSKI